MPWGDRVQYPKDRSVPTGQSPPSSAGSVPNGSRTETGKPNRLCGHPGGVTTGSKQTVRSNPTHTTPGFPGPLSLFTQEVEVYGTRSLPLTMFHPLLLTRWDGRGHSSWGCGEVDGGSRRGREEGNEGTSR